MTSELPTDASPSNEGLPDLRWSRREMLKKTAIAGGTLAWAVPAVEMVGTRVAAAASAPPFVITAGSTFTNLLPTSSGGSFLLQFNYVSPLSPAGSPVTVYTRFHIDSSGAVTITNPSGNGTRFNVSQPLSAPYDQLHGSVSPTVFLYNVYYKDVSSGKSSDIPVNNLVSKFVVES